MRSRQTEPVLDGWARVTEALANECAGTALRVPSSSSEIGAREARRLLRNDLALVVSDANCPS